MTILSKIKQLFTQVKPLPIGNYQYLSPPNNPLNYRLHLRIDPSGSGILIVNASTILYLNQSAVEYAYHIVHNHPKELVGKEISKRYRISKSMVEEEYSNFQIQIDTLIETPDLDPVIHIGFDRVSPHIKHSSAPFRLDCALTYESNNGDHNQHSPTKNVDRELTADEWKTIIDKSWHLGIPHIIFTGGEPTKKPYLAELLQYAENNGQVTGILSDGIKLADPNYLSTLLEAGLDHTTIIMQPNGDQNWESLSNFSYWAETLNEDLFVTGHLTLTKENSSKIFKLIDKLANSGISAISLSENDSSLSDLLIEARNHVDDLDIEMVWDLPVPYSSLNPVSIELEEETEDLHPAGDGLDWLYVEPDGDVLPGQGINLVLGNLLTDEWDVIWEKATKYHEQLS
jgi:hypothetical protein